MYPYSLTNLVTIQISMSFCLIFCLALLFNMSIVLEKCALDFSEFKLSYRKPFCQCHFVPSWTAGTAGPSQGKGRAATESRRIENKSDLKFKPFKHYYILNVSLLILKFKKIQILIYLYILFCSRLFLSYSILLKKMCF